MTVVEVAAADDARRWHILDDGAPVGRAALWRLSGASVRVEIIVDEPHRGRGHGTLLLAHTIEVASRDGARSVQARPSAADARSIAFASKHGFVETMRTHHLELDLAEARHDDLLQVMDRLASHAIAIVTFGDFAARVKHAHVAYADVVQATLDDCPDADDVPLDPPPHAIVAEQRANRESRLVGYTSTHGTGVRAELRGRGIATALKVAAIDAAIARGETTLTSAASHPALRHIDEKLGFRETACELRMIRQLER